MPTYRGGRHEHGQNFLTDHRITRQIIDLVSETAGPIIEIGPGRGALTFKLQQLDRPVTVVEIDADNAGWLRKRANGNTQVAHDDFLQWWLPSTPHTVVGNLPFHLTTAMLRRVLHAPGWEQAVLLVQWQVARRRAGIGGATMMTAQWWPWVHFNIGARVSSSAFIPRPSVDGGILVMSRRKQPLIHPHDKRAYRHFVHAMFTGKGNGIGVIINRRIAPSRRQSMNRRLVDEGINAAALPKDLTAVQWAGLFQAVQEHGWGSSWQ